jgi:hypothetical protein
MKTAFYLWSLVLILSLVALGLCIRVLALNGVSVSESLIFRGTGCLFLVLAYARANGLKLKPVSLRTQSLRALIAGMALTFLSLSYNWLSASAVAVLSNVDVPILVVLGPLIGVPAAFRARLLSVGSMSLLVLYVVSMATTRETLIYGLSSLMVGSLLLCFGYFYIKKSMNEENSAVAILTPALAILGYGLIEKLIVPSQPFAWNPGMVTVGLFSGVGMFMAYVATMKLYELTDLAKAEFPTLLSALVIQPIESIVSKEPLSWHCMFLTLGFIIATYFILNLQAPTDNEVAHAA